MQGIDRLFQVTGERGAHPGNGVEEMTVIICDAENCRPKKDAVELHLTYLDRNGKDTGKQGWATIKFSQLKEFPEAVGAGSISDLTGRKLAVYEEPRTTNVWLARYDGV